MDFTIKTVNESDFTDEIQSFVDLYQIQSPTSITVNRDSSTGISTIILSDQYIDRLNNVNTELVEILKSIK